MGSPLSLHCFPPDTFSVSVTQNRMQIMTMSDGQVTAPAASA